MINRHVKKERLKGIGKEKRGTDRQIDREREQETRRQRERKRKREGGRWRLREREMRIICYTLKTSLNSDVYW